jgi:hypothetical protein
LSVPTHIRTVFVHLGISLSFVPIAITRHKYNTISRFKIDVVSLRFS